MNALTQLRETALRRRNERQDDDEDERTLLGQAIHTALTPLRVITSRPAIKAYLTTLLFIITSSILVSLSTTAYLLFYYNYIPQIGSTQTIYLQYDANTHPHALVNLDTSALISQQPYDISISLLMPRTPSNVAAGNFMLDLSLLPDRAASSGPLSYLLNTTDPAAATPLARSRRPAILPYNSYVTSLSHKLLHLPIHLLSFRDLDASELKIPMFERLSFNRGRANLPTTAYIEVQSQTPPTGCPPPSSQQPGLGLQQLLSAPSPVSTSPSTLQIYSAQLHFHARFEGLRYYVYNYRILSFLLFTSLFYGFAVSSMTVAYAFIAAVISARNQKSNPFPPKKEIEGRPVKSEDSAATSSGARPKIKSEEGAHLRLEDVKAENEDDESNSDDAPNLSSTERVFPGVGRQAQALHYPTPGSETLPTDEAEATWAIQREDLDATHDAEDEDDDEDEARGRIGVITPVSGSTQEVKDENSDDERFRGDSGIGTSMESENVALGSGLVRRRSGRGGGRNSIGIGTGTGAGTGPGRGGGGGGNNSRGDGV